MDWNRKIKFKVILGCQTLIDDRIEVELYGAGLMQFLLTITISIAKHRSKVSWSYLAFSCLRDQWYSSNLTDEA